VPALPQRPVPRRAFPGQSREIRSRIVDPRKSNPESIMPAYYDTSGRTRVAPSFRDKTILSAEQIEDIVAYLVTLK
jgi:sulfur-oxidizing protein SoxX